MDILLENKLKALRAKKLEQTKEKIKKEGILDEDDYGRIVPPADLWNIISNHEDGSFYGFDAWTDNFCSLMAVHPVYVDSNDAFAGRWMYFMSKMRKNKWNPKYSYDFLKPNIEKYNIICGIGDDAHFAPDYKMGLTLGWNGLIEKIEKYKEINNTPEQLHFYNLHIRAIKAVQGWIQRHIDKIEAMIDAEEDKVKKENLIGMAETNKWVKNHPPRTLREACQWIIWFHLASRTYNRDGAGGQIDALLQPYYEKDFKEGRITDDLAIYYLGCFLINDPIYWQLGGPDKDGIDQTSRISFLILEAADIINTSLNLTVRVYDGLDKNLLRKSVEYLVKNKNGWPRFSGDKALVNGFMKNGYSAELARQRIAVGCNWMSLPGLEYTLNDLVKINMAKVFEVAYLEMVEQTSNYSTGLLWKLFQNHLSIAVQTAADGIRHHLKYQKYNEPELLLNLLSHGPLEKGKDVSDGGAAFYNLAIDGAGLAIAADSFAALEQRIENENRLTWRAVIEAVDSNYTCEGGEITRNILKNSEHYGCEGSLGEKWALKIRDLFVELVRKQTEDIYTFIPGFFSWANTVEFGEKVQATPNGRKAGEPIAHGANPVPGFTVDGASLALASSIAKIQPGYGNTAPMQWELDPSFAKEKDIEVIESIIKTHVELGGTLINVNIMDKDTVLKAHKNPSAYPELVVRVTGFTAYFSMLSPKFRQSVVDRLLEN
ncbi:MAG: pyruvate formate lyase family protein [Synergistaceae bacterium]|jgi:formate C-acetyltransferase|nr:pyruvate formate lyase family protein [Synergistaceae bacterium]